MTVITSEKNASSKFIPAQQQTADPGGVRQPRPAHDEIARAAHAIYVANGRRDGHCKENWYQAELAFHEKGQASRQQQQHPGSGVIAAPAAKIG